MGTAVRWTSHGVWVRETRSALERTCWFVKPADIISIDLINWHRRSIDQLL